MTSDPFQIELDDLANLQEPILASVTASEDDGGSRRVGIVGHACAAKWRTLELRQLRVLQRSFGRLTADQQSTPLSRCASQRTRFAPRVRKATELQRRIRPRLSRVAARACRGSSGSAKAMAARSAPGGNRAQPQPHRREDGVVTMVGHRRLYGQARADEVSKRPMEHLAGYIQGGYPAATIKPAPISGYLGPAVASRAADSLDVFVVDADGLLAVTTMDGNRLVQLANARSPLHRHRSSCGPCRIADRGPTGGQCQRQPPLRAVDPVPAGSRFLARRRDGSPHGREHARGARQARRYGPAPTAF